MGSAKCQNSLLSYQLLNARSDVTVLQYQGSLSDLGTLSLSERKGPLTPDFGKKIDTYGSEFIFGHMMGNAFVDDILLLKVVQGGTDLRVDWKTPCSTENSGNALTPSELAQDSLYDELVEKANELLDPTVLTSHFPQYDGKRIEIAGFVWFQGWNDGGNVINESNYEENLTCLVNDLRHDVLHSSSCSPGYIGTHVFGSRAK